MGDFPPPICNPGCKSLRQLQSLARSTPPQSFQTDVLVSFGCAGKRLRNGLVWKSTPWDFVEVRLGAFYPSLRCAQVAEWLMAADCKSAAPWSYGGSNPPLCTMEFAMNLEPRSPGRMWIALGLLLVFCGLAVKTIDPGKIRAVVLLLLAFFAVRIVLMGLASR